MKIQFFSIITGNINVLLETLLLLACVLLISLFRTLKTGAMTSEIKAKRDQLKAMSAAAKILVKEGAADSVNDALVMMYKDQGHDVLKSYRQWQSEGFQVKKGSKALLLWAQPQKLGKQEKKEGDPDEENEFFPLAYVFSNLQVELVRPTA